MNMRIKRTTTRIRNSDGTPQTVLVESHSPRVIEIIEMVVATGARLRRTLFSKQAVEDERKNAQHLFTGKEKW